MVDEEFLEKDIRCTSESICAYDMSAIDILKVVNALHELRRPSISSSSHQISDRNVTHLARPLAFFYHSRAGDMLIELGTECRYKMEIYGMGSPLLSLERRDELE